MIAVELYPGRAAPPPIPPGVHHGAAAGERQTAGTPGRALPPAAGAASVRQRDQERRFPPLYWGQVAALPC